MYGSPSLRFGLGYFCLLPAFLGALYCYQHSPSLLFYNTKTNPHGVLITLLFLVWAIILLTLIIIPSPFDNVNYSRSLFPQFFLPPKIQMPNKLLSKQVNDIQYSTPKPSDNRCWAAELPCTPENPKNIKLRAPERGIGAGFIRD